MDQVLEPFVAAPDQADADDALGALLTRHAAPVIRRVVVRRLGSACPEQEDLISLVTLQLMLRVRQAKADASLAAIDTFASYVATAAHHACDHYLRRKHPARWRLRNRLRYVLEHDESWSVWKADEGLWLCGRAEWRSRRDTGSLPAAGELTLARKPDARALLAQIFERSDGPFELGALVDLAAVLWSVPLVESEDATAVETIRDPKAALDVAIDQRERTRRAWRHICELPVRQRQALLLNLKGDAMNLLVMTGTASLRAIADALEMSVETLASLWNELPLADNALAVRLACTRQQVINLRMAARKRLANRLAGWS